MATPNASDDHTCVYREAPTAVPSAPNIEDLPVLDLSGVDVSAAALKIIEHSEAEMARRWSLLKEGK